jgi:hypothetical protein
MKGGSRPGAGRKKKEIVELKKHWAGDILPDAEERKYWQELLVNPKTRPDALRFLSEQKHGKAPQSMQVSGDPKKPLELIVRFIGNNPPTETS